MGRRLRGRGQHDPTPAEELSPPPGPSPAEASSPTSLNPRTNPAATPQPHPAPGPHPAFSEVWLGGSRGRGQGAVLKLSGSPGMPVDRKVLGRVE